jgi:replicative DNA helicase
MSAAHPSKNSGQGTRTLRMPPQSLDAEKALLGSLMVRPEVVNDVLDLVREESFYAEKHAIIFRSIIELVGRSEPIDLVSVTERLRANGTLEAAGGKTYIADIVSMVPAATSALFYAKNIAEKAVLRNLIRAGDSVSELGFQEHENLEDLCDAAEKVVHSVTDRTHTRSYEKLKDILPRSWETIERLHGSTEELRGVPTGFRDLDNKLAGLQPADLIILAARPSVGKTSLALDIARQTALHHNTAVGIFSLEMSAQSLTDRMVAAEARVDAWRMRTSKLTDDDFGKIQEAMGRLSAAPIYISDEASMTVVGIRSIARKLKSDHNLGLIIVDYLQLITPSKNYDNMVNQVSEISRALKQLARELSVPVLALSQLSRAVESRGGRPRLSDLRDSGAIEQDADIVAFIHREDKYQQEPERPNIAEIIIEKHRNGPTGVIELYFDGAKTTFLTIDKNDYSDLVAPAAMPSGAF